MEVNHVEAMGLLKDPLEHEEVGGDGIPRIRIESQSAGAYRDQLGVRFRVAAGEQRDVVAEGHQLFGEVGDDALRPP